MNKAELTDAVAAKTDLTKADASRAIDATIDAISGALSSGDNVALVGFGTFSVRHRAARQGRNPQTGATIQIQASKSAGFKAGKALKDKLN
ncbi:MAG: HU family DNA-binding protein [SAR86 cluster bacterium]|nr:HU family DNA-binding protein [SAR86 cluster bacterium]